MKKFFYLSLLFSFSLFLFPGCTTQQNNSESLYNYENLQEQGVKDGGVRMIPIHTAKGTFRVWTKQRGNNPKIKVLLLHGGPGCSHEYLECFDSFFPKEGIEFFYYDQLGSFFSDQPKDTSLWHVNRFVNEVEQVRKALKLDSSNFFLFGHSWGGILAIEYALKYQKNLKGLIISNMVCSIPAYNKYAENVLAKQMPPTILAQIEKLEKAKNFKNPQYSALLDKYFYPEHILRLKEYPDPVNRGFNHCNETVYTLMQGPSEFRGSGRLLHWDRSDDLHKITVPTLTIGAKYDTMDPELMKWMAAQMPNGKYLYCAKGSHLAMYDDQQAYFQGLIHFIKSVGKENVTD